MNANKHPDYAMVYSEFVDSRAKTPDAIHDSLTIDKVDLLHAVWGIAGEVMEYYLAPNQSNKIEELHDIGFYIQLIENRFGDVTIQLAPETSSFDLSWSDKEKLLRAANTFFDLAKKYVIYNQADKQDALVNAFHTLKYVWAEELRLVGITVEEANLLNQAKLIKRYATGYSDKAAAERADKPAGE